MLNTVKHSKVFLHPLGRMLMLRTMITVASRALAKPQKQGLL